MKTLTKVVLLAVALTGGCKVGNEDGDSDLDFSEKAKAAIDEITFSKEQLANICGQDSLIVFVGNGEKLGLSPVFPTAVKGAKHSRQAQVDAYNAEQDKNHVQFVKAIEIAAADLKVQLAKKACGRGSNPTTLATVIDGPGRDDSRIEITEFAPTGAIQASKSFTYIKKVLEEQAAGKKFELNMARDIPDLLKAIRNRRDKAKAFTQISYFFKTHGAVHRKTDTGTGIGHVLLFDTNGPEAANLHSNLWFPVWTTEGLYEICGRKRDEKHPNFQFCKNMLTEFSDAIQGTAGNGTGGTAGNGKGGTAGNGTGGTAGNGTGGTAGNGTGGTAGNGTGGTAGNGTGGTAGNGTGGTAGNGTGGTAGNGTGGTAGNGTGGTAGNGTGGTAGNGTGGTAGNGTGGTAGNGTGGTAGNGTGGTSDNGTGGTAGNGTGGTSDNGTGGTSDNGTGGSQLSNYVVEMGDPEASKLTYSEIPKADPLAPQGYLVLGEAASYTYKEHPKALENVVPLTLPVPVLRPGAKERQPLLVVFDSCNMSNEFDDTTLVAQSGGSVGGIGALDGAGSGVYALTEVSPSQPVVTLANENSLYYFAMNYGLLEGQNYKALPYIYYWGLPNGKKDGKPVYHPRSSKSVREAAKIIEATLGDVGLDRERVIEHSIDPNEDERKKIKQEYLQIRPRIFYSIINAAGDD